MNENVLQITKNGNELWVHAWGEGASTLEDAHLSKKSATQLQEIVYAYKLPG